MIRFSQDSKQEKEIQEIKKFSFPRIRSVLYFDEMPTNFDFSVCDKGGGYLYHIAARGDLYNSTTLLHNEVNIMNPDNKDKPSIKNKPCIKGKSFIKEKPFIKDKLSIRDKPFIMAVI